MKKASAIIGLILAVIGALGSAVKVWTDASATANVNKWRDDKAAWVDRQFYNLEHSTKPVGERVEW